MGRLLELYKKTQGGHVLLPDEELEEYGHLRKVEYQLRKVELEQLGCTNIKPVKDDTGDIIGFMWSNSTPHD
jgi:hypothetical protein